MSGVSKRMLDAASAAAGGSLDVDDVFSTYLYEGNASGQGANAQSITNHINLAGEGGLVWLKNRDTGGSNAWSHYLFDTERGVTKYIRTNLDSVEGISNNSLSAFNSDGFTLGETGGTNNNGDRYVSWTFRKAPKFFDVVTYTGDGNNSQDISHNLGVAPGFVIIKRTDSTGDWGIYSYTGGSSGFGDCSLKLNSTEAELSPIAFSSQSTYIRVFTSSFKINANIQDATYVAYLFANNDGDGGFGPNSDQDIIKVGKYTGGVVQTINLGFEPQWLLIKDVTGTTSDWFLIDTARGFAEDINYLNPNGDYNEGSDQNIMAPTPNGFRIFSTNNNYNGGGKDYVYIAIRKGPLKSPTSGTSVFDTYLPANTARSTSIPFFESSFTPDAAIDRFQISSATNGARISSRLTGDLWLPLYTTSSQTSNVYHDYNTYMNGWYTNLGSAQGGDDISWMWRRAPGYFDVVTYTGVGAGTTFSHNLGVTPEMIWIKNRSRANTDWNAYHKDLELNGAANTAMDCILFPNLDNGISGITDYWGASGPSNTQVTLGTNNNNCSFPGDIYIAYLFASISGVSKLGSYVGNGTSLDIDCGFSNGSAFVLIKRTDAAGDWNVFDSVRGITIGNDPCTALNLSTAQTTSIDVIRPYSSGFTVRQDGTDDRTNASGAEYIFYAVS